MKRTSMKAIDLVTIHCGNHTEYMTRQLGLKKYLRCMNGCEGSERERYTNIYCKLRDGLSEVDDSYDWDNYRNHR